MVRAIILYFRFQFSLHQSKQNHRVFFLEYNWIGTQATHQICAPKAITPTQIKSEGTGVAVRDTELCAAVFVLAHNEARTENQTELFPCLINQPLCQGPDQSKRSGRPLSSPFSPWVPSEAGMKTRQGSSSLLLPGRKLSKSQVRARASGTWVQPVGHRQLNSQEEGGNYLLHFP